MNQFYYSNNTNFIGHVLRNTFFENTVHQKQIVEQIPMTKEIGKMPPEFGLINMNGRVYDPYTSQFLSPDPFVQNPANPQNYNRFSYVLNNPLKFTDPSGYNYGDPYYNYFTGFGGMGSSNNSDAPDAKWKDWLTYWDNQWQRGNTDFSLLDYYEERRNEVNNFLSSKGIIGMWLTKSRLVDAEQYYSELVGTSMQTNTTFLASSLKQIPEFWSEFVSFDTYVSNRRQRGMRMSGVKEGEKWYEGKPKVSYQDNNIIIVPTRTTTYTNILDESLYRDFKYQIIKNYNLILCDPAPNYAGAIAIISAFGAACCPVIDEPPYLTIFAPHKNITSIYDTYTNSKAKAIKDLQKKRLQLYLNSGFILDFNE
jgi:RHS repeat-associated protein